MRFNFKFTLPVCATSGCIGEGGMSKGGTLNDNKRAVQLKTSPKHGNLTARASHLDQKNRLTLSTQRGGGFRQQGEPWPHFPGFWEFYQTSLLVRGGVSVVQVFKESRKEGTKPTQAWEIQFFWEQVIPTRVDKAPNRDQDPDALIILSMWLFRDL